MYTQSCYIGTFCSRYEEVLFRQLPKMPVIPGRSSSYFNTNSNHSNNNKLPPEHIYQRLKNKTSEQSLTVTLDISLSRVKFQRWSPFAVKCPYPCCVFHMRYRKTNVAGKGDLGTDQLPPFVDRSHAVQHHLTSGGVKSVCRLLNIIAHERPDITYSPLLFTLTSILSHYLDEAACYACVSSLVTSKQRYVAQTVISHQAQTTVLSELALDYVVCTVFLYHGAGCNFFLFSGMLCLQCTERLFVKCHSTWLTC